MALAASKHVKSIKIAVAVIAPADRRQHPDKPVQKPQNTEIKLQNEYKKKSMLNSWSNKQNAFQIERSNKLNKTEDTQIKNRKHWLKEQMVHMQC